MPERPLLFVLPFALALTPVAVRPVDEATLESLLRGAHEGPLVVNFFATWCAPCAAELPILQTIVAAHPSASALFVSLDNLGEGPRVQAFVDRTGLLAPVVHLQARDPAGTMARLVPGWPERIPVTMVFHPDGTEAARFVGVVKAPELSAALGAPGELLRP